MIIRKNYICNFIIFFISINSIKSLCIKGENCPIDRGFCSEGQCICFYSYVTFNKYENQNNIIYCNYQKVNRVIPLILEFFFPSMGLLFIGRLIHGFIKLCLAIYIILCGKKIISFNLIVVGFSSLVFLILHAIDLICLTFAFYRDGNGISLL